MDMQKLIESGDMVRNQLGEIKPILAAVLGSGWSSVVDKMPILASIDYAKIPCLGAVGVKGHAGRLLAVECGSETILIFQGRRHWYEGVGWTPVAFPVYLSKIMGVEIMLLTNAAGGMRKDMHAGEIMVITDHVNAMGVNPLIGPHEAFWGDRFPDQTKVYDSTLRRAMMKAGKATGIDCSEGVYVAVPGPTYETPAEIRTFGMRGDAIGMSTVPEAMLANAAGLRVVAVSCITNLAAGVSGTPLSHDEVITQTKASEKGMRSLLASFFDSLSTIG